MKRASYLNKMQDDFSSDRLGIFLNSVDVIPHGFGHQYGSGDFTTHGYRLTGDFEILFFIDGESHITVGSNKYLCKKGDFIFIPPFVRHSIETTWENPHDNYWMHFDIDPLSSRQKFINLFTHSGDYRIKIKNFEILRNIYKTLEGEYDSKQPGFLALFKASALYVIVQALKNIEINMDILENKKVNTNLQLLADRVLTHMDENISEVDSVKSVCRKFSISRTYLNNIFMNTIGVSPGKMIQYIKLKKAEHILLTTDKSIEEISDMLGYSSAGYFSNTFKKNYGVSPNIFRKIAIE
jgi:AraC-like DNA-binding protein